MKTLENYGLNEYYDIKKLIEQNHPLLRIASYSGDIAEVAINMSTEAS